MVFERMGTPTTLALHFKGDLKRETRWLAQYGQFICTVTIALLIYQLDRIPGHRWAPAAVLVVMIGTSLASTLIKRLLGRARPGREHAGKFLGFTWQHSNARESFPSSHSASAVALSVSLTILYPQGAAVFWALALACALLRYLMDAHWPSDVLAGIALGYAIGAWVTPAILRYS